MSTKAKIITAIVVIGAILIAIFQFGLGGPGAERGVDTIQTESPVVVATNPAAMKEKKTVVVLPTQSIEITFNQPLENVPETRITIEPKADYKVELSSDKKTIKIIKTVTPNIFSYNGKEYDFTDYKFEVIINNDKNEKAHFVTIGFFCEAFLAG
jgi:hypothetical protein